MDAYPQSVASLTNSTASKFHSIVAEAMIHVSARDHKHGSIWLDSRLATFYVAAISLLALASHLLINTRRSTSRTTPVPEPCEGALAFLARYGAAAIGFCKVARLAFTTALTVVSVSTILVAHEHQQTLLPLILEGLAVAYANILALLVLVVAVPKARVVSGYTTLITITLFFVYAYRDVWPLMTYTLRLEDSDDWKLWTKLGLAGISGILIPLIEPTPYIPVNPERPQKEISPEQTASLFSFLTYMFVGPLIAAANRVSHLPADALPPLMDTDAPETLVAQGEKYLDPLGGSSKNSNAYLNLVKLTPRDWGLALVAAIITPAFEISGTVGLNRLLNYLESGGDGIVRPWVWILIMGGSPFFHAMANELMSYYTTQITVKTSSTITATVIEHSLRVRANANAPPNANSTQKPAATPAPAVADEVPPITRPDVQDGTSVASEGIDPSRASTVVGSDATDADTAKDQPPASTDLQPPPTPAEPAQKKAGKHGLVGRVNNLITSDIGHIVKATHGVFWFVIKPPVTVTLAMVFLYKILGWSSLVGLAVMILLLPVPAKMSALLEGTMEVKMKATDARVETITETLSVIRMIKLFGWESRIKNEIGQKRKSELDVVWRARKFEYNIDFFNHILPLLHIIVTYTIYTLIMKKPLNASIIFSAMSAFDMIRNQVEAVTWTLPQILRARVSVRRLHEFLNETELLDRFSAPKSPVVSQPSSHDGQIGFNAASFSWTNDSNDGAVTPSRAQYRLCIEDTLLFKRNTINMIIGPTGSGKTALLNALLGEMHFLPSGPNSWFNLPRNEGIAYAPQESWVLNATIRENIVFNAPFDQARYNKTIHQCGLERDLGLFEAGDATEVGEKGITLSGGQKGRITLARAVYSSANILILDDVLAALDVHTARWVVNKCLKGDLLRDRTVLLVTHNVAMVNPIAGYVVALGTDGRILSQGSLSDALDKDSHLVEDDPEEGVTDDSDALEPERATVSAKEGGKLIVEEEVAVGRVGWSAFMLLVKSMGGNWAKLWWTAYFAFSIVTRLQDAVNMWWLGWWAHQYELRDPLDVQVPFYLGTYAGIVVFSALVFIAFDVIFMKMLLRSSRTIHERLISALIGSTFRWLDTTPMSRLLTRCTQDISSIDETVPYFLSIVIDKALMILTKLGSVVIFTPIFALVGLVLGGAGYLLGMRFMNAQLPVKRESAKTKAPVLATVDSVIAGLVSIRAYQAETTFRQQAHERIGKQTRTQRSFGHLNRWVAMRTAVITSAFTTTLGWYMVYINTDANASNVGFSLVQGMGFSSMILAWIRQFNILQTDGNSLERIQAYIKVEQEPEPKKARLPPAYWPASGEVRVENMSARYSLDGPKVLHDVSFAIKSGERIGVVGRTGSGKSSLTLSLLRCIYTEGKVYFDGIPTDSINLDALRSKITIIPQAPELLSGTLRHNLDIFGEHDDATLNDALRAAGLNSIQTDADETKLTLDSAIGSSGGNLSVGQRQITALARALVRRSKLLILDEATSAIDYETDTVIQTSLRKELGSDVSVITIAHRLQTIMDSDKIMVLDAGKLVEFDTPKALLQKEKSFLRALVDESSDKEALHAMARNM